MPVDRKERERRRRLLEAHVAAENAHDLDAIMATFAPHALGVANGIVATTGDELRRHHALLGLSSVPGIMTGALVVPEVEHFTDEEIVVEGHLCGKHTGTAPGLPAPTNRDVALPYIAVYRFDDSGLLASERVRMDLSSLYVVQSSLAGGTP